MHIEVGRVSFSLIGKKPNNTLGPLAAFSINDIAVALEKRAENMLVGRFFLLLLLFFVCCLLTTSAQLNGGRH
jgi:hypothetical protein